MNKYDFKLMGNTIMNYEGPDYDGKEGNEPTIDSVLGKVFDKIDKTPPRLFNCRSEIKVNNFEDEGRNGLYNFPDDLSQVTIKSEHSGERKIVVKEIDYDDFADSVIQELNDELILKDLIIKDLENSIDKTCKEGTTCYAKISQLRVENVDLIYKNYNLKQITEREVQANKNSNIILEELSKQNKKLKLEIDRMHERWRG